MRKNRTVPEDLDTLLGSSRLLGSAGYCWILVLGGGPIGREYFHGFNLEGMGT